MLLLLQSSQVNRTPQDSINEIHYSQVESFGSCKFQIHLCILASVMSREFTREAVIKLLPPHFTLNLTYMSSKQFYPLKDFQSDQIQRSARKIFTAHYACRDADLNLTTVTGTTNGFIFQITNSLIGQCKTKTADCRLQTADCGPGVKCRLSVKCRLQSAVRRLRFTLTDSLIGFWGLRLTCLDCKSKSDLRDHKTVSMPFSVQKNWTRINAGHKKTYSDHKKKNKISRRQLPFTLHYVFSHELVLALHVTLFIDVAII